MNDGLLSFRDRKKHDSEEHKSHLRSRNAGFNPYKYVSPTVFSTSATDHLILHEARPRLKGYDKQLKKFNSTAALDEALSLKTRVHTPQVTIGVMQELIRRGTIKAALAGKSEKSLGILIKFIQRYKIKNKIKNLRIFFFSKEYK